MRTYRGHVFNDAAGNGLMRNLADPSVHDDEQAVTEQNATSIRAHAAKQLSQLLL